MHLYALRYDKKTCQPLVEYFDISHFITVEFPTRVIFTFCRIEWSFYYFAEKLFIDQPSFRHPKNFTSGLPIARQIEDEKYQNLRRLASEKFNINFGVA